MQQCHFMAHLCGFMLWTHRTSSWWYGSGEDNTATIGLLPSSRLLGKQRDAMLHGKQDPSSCGCLLVGMLANGIGRYSATSICVSTEVELLLAQVGREILSTPCGPLPQRLQCTAPFHMNASTGVFAAMPNSVWTGPWNCVRERFSLPVVEAYIFILAHMNAPSNHTHTFRSTGWKINVFAVKAADPFSTFLLQPQPLCQVWLLQPGYLFFIKR